MSLFQNMFIMFWPVKPKYLFSCVMITKCLSGKTAIVTGANRGMGYEVALTLAGRNATVIMLDKRNQTESRNKIISKTCNENVYDEYVDLASFHSVRCCAEKILGTHKRIDILINNAGVFCMDKKKTEDCLDGVMQTNHLGPFLLTNLLTDLLIKSSGSRVVYVTSNGAFFHNMNVKKLTEPCYFPPHYISGALHYYNSKLCNMITAKILAEKLRKFNVSCNSVHPGMTSTEFLVCNANRLKKYLTMKVLELTTKNVKDAAAEIVFVATSGSVKNITGKYFSGYRVNSEPTVLEDRNFCIDIWNESSRLCFLEERPEKTNHLLPI